ncbi:cell division cycle-associated protein 3 [Melanotaenia boesemani]|uniref:cell division cycle-associated protein 3 n=1 Tax=Melanotaenia boesemani TaxID=1250792 RepID=UPI001C056DE8|nr:cell division cycle-associated protein 3 [Melanotaenia boesemani]
MGTSESKMAVTAGMKPESAIKKSHFSQLMDPRSPSAVINRTPIQVGGIESKTSAEVKSECHLAFIDPRSPTIGIIRTPVRDVMRATVGSFARRLGMLFHNEAEGKAPEGPQKCFSDAVEEDLGGEELASTKPLLSSQLAQNFGSLAEHANLLASPVLSPLQTTNDSSPFVFLEAPQVEVEIETEADISLEEAEEARESPLHKRLSMSLITCHEGVTSSQIYSEVHNESVETLTQGVDHSYALPSVTVEPESPEPSLTTDTDNSPVEESPVQPEETEKVPISQEAKALQRGSSLLPESCLSKPPTVSSPEQPQACTGIRCPAFDIKSPSQVEFKPQWLGKGFGAPGLRARGMQGLSGKGGSSPLAVRVAVKNVTNENKGQSGKLKQKGTEGRSPLQILKEANSPRDQHSQMKLKVSTQDKQRFGQMDRRVQAVSLDKENR